MTITSIVTLLRNGVLLVFKLASPILGAAIVIGLIVAIFQATTSIQEQTLTFVPKLFAILAMLFLLGGWMFSQMRGYTINLFEMIPQMAR